MGKCLVVSVKLLLLLALATSVRCHTPDPPAPAHAPPNSSLRPDDVQQNFENKPPVPPGADPQKDENVPARLGHKHDTRKPKSVSMRPEIDRIKGGRKAKPAVQDLVSHRTYYTANKEPSTTIITTTTTTLDPWEEFCKEACQAGVGGLECDCADHPIG